MNQPPACGWVRMPNPPRGCCVYSVRMQFSSPSQIQLFALPTGDSCPVEQDRIALGSPALGKPTWRWLTRKMAGPDRRLPSNSFPIGTVSLHSDGNVDVIYDEEFSELQDDQVLEQAVPHLRNESDTAGEENEFMPPDEALYSEDVKRDREQDEMRQEIQSLRSELEKSQIGQQEVEQLKKHVGVLHSQYKQVAQHQARQVGAAAPVVQPPVPVSPVSRQGGAAAFSSGKVGAAALPVSSQGKAVLTQGGPAAFSAVRNVGAAAPPVTNRGIVVPRQGGAASAGLVPMTLQPPNGPLTVEKFQEFLTQCQTMYHDRLFSIQSHLAQCCGLPVAFSAWVTKEVAFLSRLSNDAVIREQEENLTRLNTPDFERSMRQCMMKQCRSSTTLRQKIAFLVNYVKSVESHIYGFPTSISQNMGENTEYHKKRQNLVHIMRNTAQYFIKLTSPLMGLIIGKMEYVVRSQRDPALQRQLKELTERAVSHLQNISSIQNATLVHRIQEQTHTILTRSPVSGSTEQLSQDTTRLRLAAGFAQIADYVRTPLPGDSKSTIAKKRQMLDNILKKDFTQEGADAFINDMLADLRALRTPSGAAAAGTKQTTGKGRRGKAPQAPVHRQPPVPRLSPVVLLWLRRESKKLGSDSPLKGQLDSIIRDIENLGKGSRPIEAIADNIEMDRLYTELQKAQGSSQEVEQAKKMVEDQIAEVSKSVVSK